MPSDDACANLSPGDILFVTFRSDNPDVVAMVALRDISSVDLFLTDNAWIARTQEFRTNEGTVQLSGRSMAAGTVFGYASASSSTTAIEDDLVLYGNEWTNVAGSFALSASGGDNLFLYCQRPNGAVHFLAALTTGGDWVYEDDDDNQDSDNSNNTALTALPVALQSAALVLPHYDNYQYTGTVTGTKADLQEQLLDATNWVGSNTPQQDSAPPEAFTVIMSTPESDGLLEAGDVMVVGVHSDNPDLVALVALTDIAAGTRLSITDNAWTGTEFRSNEGTLVLRVPEPGISSGTVFGYGAGLLQYGDQWTAADDDAGFALSAEGDTLVVYSTTTTTTATTAADDAVADGSGPSAPHHLGAFSFNGPWMPAGLEDEEDYGTDSSALPAALLEFSTALPHSDNYVYAGPMSGTKGAIQAALRDPSNWRGSNSVLVFGESALSSSMSFEILQETSGVIVWRTFSHGIVSISVVGSLAAVSMNGPVLVGTKLLPSMLQESEHTKNWSGACTAQDMTSLSRRHLR